MQKNQRKLLYIFLPFLSTLHNSTELECYMRTTMFTLEYGTKMETRLFVHQLTQPMGRLNELTQSRQVYSNVGIIVLVFLVPLSQFQMFPLHYLLHYGVVNHHVAKFHSHQWTWCNTTVGVIRYISTLYVHACFCFPMNHPDFITSCYSK